MKNYYAEQAVWGSDFHRIIRFAGRAERDEYVRTHDFSNRILAADALRCGVGYEYIDGKVKEIEYFDE